MSSGEGISVPVGGGVVYKREVCETSLKGRGEVRQDVNWEVLSDQL